VAGMCDGHGILDPQALVDAGLPAEVADQLTVVHRSDGTPKGTLYRNGQPASAIEGVYGLHLLEFLAGALGVEYRRCLGRGSQACAIQQAIQDLLTTSFSGVS